jgi:hypothetical protein
MGAVLADVATAEAIITRATGQRPALRVVRSTATADPLAVMSAADQYAQAAQDAVLAHGTGRYPAAARVRDEYREVLRRGVYGGAA